MQKNPLKAKNTVTLIALVSLIVILFFVTIVKISAQH
jgi:hypothetical protein